jgi:hypothetical protein
MVKNKSLAQYRHTAVVFDPRSARLNNCVGSCDGYFLQAVKGQRLLSSVPTSATMTAFA